MGTENLMIGDDNNVEDDVEEIEENMKKVVDMKLEEHIEGRYAFPEFIFSKKEEEIIYKPRSRGVIVKLLGRSIRYKALETILKQIWVRKRVINIIDLRNDYYSVIFLMKMITM